MRQDHVPVVPARSSVDAAASDRRVREAACVDRTRQEPVASRRRARLPFAAARRVGSHHELLTLARRDRLPQLDIHVMAGHRPKRLVRTGGGTNRDDLQIVAQIFLREDVENIRHDLVRTPARTRQHDLAHIDLSHAKDDILQQRTLQLVPCWQA